MHSSCFATYIRYNYTCPLCTKSIGDMTVYFQVGGGGLRERAAIVQEDDGRSIDS